MQRKERDIAEFNNRLGEEQASVGIVVIIIILTTFIVSVIIIVILTTVIVIVIIMFIIVNIAIVIIDSSFLSCHNRQSCHCHNDHAIYFSS